MKSTPTKENDRRLLFLTMAGCLGLLATFGGCGHMHFAHTTPGGSIDVAMAKKAEPVATPTPAPEREKVSMASETAAKQDALTENIADYYTLGNLMMQQQKYDEAIKAFVSAVKLDPTFSDAWNHLAICYQNTGQADKATEAFKKYKTIAEQQPAKTTDNAQ